MTDQEDNDKEVVNTSEEVEVEVIDDTPEKDKGIPRRAEGVQPDIPDEDEIGNYSDRVQSRIKKLSYEFHEERRAKEEAIRLQEEAVNFAKTKNKEIEDLRKRLRQSDVQSHTHVAARVDAEMAKTKKELKDAYESGDSDAIVDAQEKMSTLAGARAQITARSNSMKNQQETEKPVEEFNQKPVPRVNIPEPDPKAKDWASKNSWFGKDKPMTSYVFGLHEKLVSEGYDPASDEYYSEIDKDLKNTFPNRYDSGNVQNRGNVVAPAGRNSGSNPRKVNLTQSEVKLAKRLGITTQQFAAQKLKEMNNVG